MTKGETFWDRLQEAFDQANAPTIARRLNVEKQTVYKWRDGTIPGLDTLLMISQSTGRSLHWLVTGQGPQFIETSGSPHFKIEIPSDEPALSPADRKLVESLISVLERSLKKQ